MTQSNSQGGDMRDPLLEDEENRAHSNGLHDEHDEREDSEASDDDEV